MMRTLSIPNQNDTMVPRIKLAVTYPEMATVPLLHGKRLKVFGTQQQ